MKRSSAMAGILFLVLLGTGLYAEIVVKQDENGRLVVSNRPGISSRRVRFKTAARYPVIPREIQVKIRQLARKYGLREDLITAVARAESGFNPYAISKAGAVGIMQLMHETAQRYKVKNRFDTNENLEAGVKHLSALWKKYQGNLVLTLAAYNAGEGAVKKYNGVPPYRETKTYIKRVLAFMGLKQNGAAQTRSYKKLYKYTTREGRVIITDRLPARIDGRVEILE